jgi:transcriptional regulator with XRE-family HTH domain
MDNRSVRRFLNLRLQDVARATGISPERISQAERGLIRLRPSEATAVRNFLQMKLRGATARADEQDADGGAR